MNMLNTLKLSQRFAILIAVFMLGFAVYGGWSFKTLSDLKVNGPLYQRIVQGKDLVADILPPPEYILESYLVSFQLSGEADKAEQDRLIGKLKALKGDYDTRHEFWLKEGLGGELDDIFLKQAHEPAIEFYRTVFGSLVPAVQQGDRTALNAAMERIKHAYESHRLAIDRAVQITNARMAADEAAAKERIDSASVLLLAILGVSIAAAMVVAAAIIRGLLASLGGEPEYAAKIARAIADCDLTVPIHTRHGDQSSLLAAMKTMQASLVAIIGSVNSSVEQLAQSASQLTKSAKRVSETASQQNASTQSMAAAMEEISVSIDQITDNAKETERNTVASGEISCQGLGMVNDATQEMNRVAEAVNNSSRHISGLGDQSGEISAIVNAIKDIADQTNLLALNAAIEAARAGEQGRGFAVVADEVRKLAERTTRSTQEISGMIGGIENGTRGAVSAMGDANARMGAGVKMVDRVRQSIEEIKGSTDNVIGAVRGMTEALREQSSAHSLVAGNVSMIAEKTEQTSLEVGAIAQAAGALESLSAALKASVNQFKMA